MNEEAIRILEDRSNLLRKFQHIKEAESVEISKNELNAPALFADQYRKEANAIDLAIRALKEQSIGEPLTLDQLREMECINKFEKTPLTAEQVYTFTIRLCNNEVDRDYERFETAGLERLGELFLGRSGIFDHQWSARGQTARIYRTEVVAEPGRITAAGDGYCWLKGWAYLLRTEANGELIAEIEGGIKKEVSVGCSVAESVCSVCGAPTGTCHHVKGEIYDGKLCFTELRKPVEAYEWAFVEAPT